MGRTNGRVGRRHTLETFEGKRRRRWWKERREARDGLKKTGERRGTRTRLYKTRREPLLSASETNSNAQSFHQGLLPPRPSHSQSPPHCLFVLFLVALFFFTENNQFIYSTCVRIFYSKYTTSPLRVGRHFPRARGWPSDIGLIILCCYFIPLTRRFGLKPTDPFYIFFV